MPRSRTGWHCQRCHNDAKFLTGIEHLHDGQCYVWSVMSDLEGSEICLQVERLEYQPLCRQCWRAQMQVMEDDGINVVRVQ